MSTTQAESPSQPTAPNLTVEAGNGVTYAVRRFGGGGGRPPLLFLQHFRGNLDNWNPCWSTRSPRSER